VGNQWQKIGEVVDAVGSGRKQLYEGKEYDYVFDVDIQDGVPPLKLPYNANGMFHHLHKGRINYTYLQKIRSPLPNVFSKRMTFRSPILIKLLNLSRKMRAG
jgi:PFU (PLAA family ubiquitin binding)